MLTSSVDDILTMRGWFPHTTQRNSPGGENFSFGRASNCEPNCVHTTSWQRGNPAAKQSSDERRQEREVLVRKEGISSKISAIAAVKLYEKERKASSSRERHKRGRRSLALSSHNLKQQQIKPARESESSKHSSPWISGNIFRIQRRKVRRRQSLWCCWEVLTLLSSTGQGRELWPLCHETEDNKCYYILRMYTGTFATYNVLLSCIR